jgi:predicted ATPase
VEPLQADDPKRAADYLDQAVDAGDTDVSTLGLLADAYEGPTGLVGREAELALLHERLRSALAGERQIVFVTGEAGIGKTAFVTTFLQQIAQRADIWIARGQCIEHYGAGEAYLPVLEALSRLGREAGRKRLARLLRQYAPTWLAQLPAFLNATERDKGRRATVGVTRERMLRELAEAVEVLTAQVGLVLWIEDMQWSDPSTLEWVGYVARRAGPARLLVVGTCRPVAVLEQGHPLHVLTQELLLYGQGVELELRGLTVSAVSDYLCRRMGYEERGACHTLAQAMHQRTEGHPLFIVNVMEYLHAQGALTPSNGLLGLRGALALVQQEVPPRLQQLIARHLAQLRPEEQRLLEVASVAGAEFSAAAVAAGLESSIEEVEEHCAALARRALFVKPCGMTGWPDGTVATRYAFCHAFYTSVLYERLPASRCRALHERLGRCLEQAYRGRAREVATELALHYERGRQYGQAIHYLRQAGENASRRSAHSEAISLLRKGLDLLQTLPETSRTYATGTPTPVGAGCVTHRRQGVCGTRGGRRVHADLCALSTEQRCAATLCCLTGAQRHVS